MIDKIIFGNVLEHPSQISVSELAELSDALARCPSSAILRSLVWMGSKVSIPQFEVLPSQLELYLPNPAYVAKCLEPLHAPFLEEPPLKSAAPSALAPLEVSSDALADNSSDIPAESSSNVTTQLSSDISDSLPLAAPASQNEDIMNEINAYHDISFKTAPKSVILSNFLETANCKIDDSVPTPATPIEELAKKSISFDNSLCTETLAVVLEKQGKFEKAIAIYEKLMCKYPEKISTFANRIEALKTKIVNK